MEFLGLPAEMRPLALFLEQDHRPTAILTGGRLEDDHDTLYQNPAFERLAFDKSRLRNLGKAFGCELAQKHSQTGHFDGCSWRWNSLNQGWSSLVCNGQIDSEEDGQIAAVGREEDGDVIKEDQMLVTVNSHTGSARAAERVQLDWTQFPVSDLSPWVQYVRDYDWASTSLGPMHSWPPMLRQYATSVMSNPNPRVLIWGDDMICLHNEACGPVFGKKHPGCLGQKLTEVWSQVWSDLGPSFEGAYDGKITTMDQVLVAFERGETLEHVFFDFTLLPIVGPDGHGIGVLDELRETTEIVRGARRRTAVVKLSEEVSSANNLNELWSGALTGLEGAVDDVAFALCYAVVDDIPESISEHSDPDTYCASQRKCVLQGTVGLGESHKAYSDRGFEEYLNTSGLVKPRLSSWKSRKPILLTMDDGSLPEMLNVAVEGRVSGEKVRSVLVTPINPSSGILGILVLGLSPVCPLDTDYRLWTDVVADLLVKAATFITVPEEERRARKISDSVNSALAQQLRTTTLQVERSEAKFSRMAQTAPTGIYVLDKDGHPLYVNDTYLQMMDEVREDFYASARPFSEWHTRIHPDDYKRFVDAWHRVVDGKEPVTIEYRLAKPWKSVDKVTGQVITGETWLMANAFPEVDNHDNVESVQGWLTDISHRKFTENLLAQRLEDALENKRQSETFIDMTSHEMRNPLSAILQSADSIVSALDSIGMPMLNEDLRLTHDEADELLDAAQVIILCAQHQKRIVDDILTLSKLDASLLVLSPDNVQPPLLLERAIKMYEAELARAEIKIVVRTEPSYTELDLDWVVLDSSRLLQVIINLLTNAIKFTQYSDHREIIVCLGASLERPTGKHHNVNFIPVKQGRSTHAMRADLGDGQDLFLQIAVTDTGRGLSEEEMKVLFQRFSQASPKTYKQYGGSGLGLFISRELAELQGGQIGVCCDEGKTTFSFFVKTRRLVADAVPDAIPKPSSPSFSSNSASPMVYTRRGSTLLNPPPVSIDQNQSNGTAATLSPDRRPVQNGEQKQSEVKKVEKDEAANDSLHVLIVEDNLINQKVMSQQLRRAGCTVHVANHGLECLDFLEQSDFCSAQTPLSIILLDLEMPTMDGLTCIRHIRQQQQTGKINSHVPVIAVTANARSEQISGAIEAGMDQVVTKPFRIPELMPQMHSLVLEVTQRQAG